MASTAPTRRGTNSTNFLLRPQLPKLLRPNSEDFPALNLDFDAEGRTQIGALYDRSSDPDASRKIGQFERVKDSAAAGVSDHRSEEHTSELQSHLNLVCRLLLEKKKRKTR